MIVVYKLGTFHENPKNAIIPTVTKQMFGGDEALYLQHIKEEVRKQLWEADCAKSPYTKDVSTYELPTIMNVF